MTTTRSQAKFTPLLRHQDLDRGYRNGSPDQYAREKALIIEAEATECLQVCVWDQPGSR
jgi:hypothetical protein